MSGRDRKPSNFYGDCIMDMAAVKKAFSATIRRRKPKPAPVETVPEEQPLNHGNDKKEKKPREQHEVGEMTKTSLQKRRLKADSNPVHKKIKKVQVDVAAMNPKADAMENALIVRAKEEQQLIMRHAKRTIAVGATELPSVESAVKKGVKDSCALVIDFVSPETKHIGKLCKVYWDGENQWFYARILYYDSQHDKYFIYYLEDSTAEWISMSEEQMFVASEIVIAKNRGFWLAMKFAMTKGAMDNLASIGGFQGYHNGRVYIEYFSETSVREYEFLAHDYLLPLDEENMPKVRSKKFMACFNSATDEKETIETVRQLVSASVKDLIRSGIPLSVFGRQLIHVRVRARTNNISQDLIREIVADMESDSTDMNKKESTGRSGKSFDNVYSKEYVNPSTSLPTAKKLNEPKKLQISRLPCVGTVTLYCPSLQEHFVIFDAAHLQPQWVSFLKNEVELILGTDDAAETTVAVLNGIKAHESSLILLNNHRLQRQADKKNVLSIKARLESFAIENDNKKAVQKDPVAKPVKKNGYRKGQRRWKKHTKDKKSDSSCKEVDHSQTIDSDEEGSENGDNIDIDEDKQVQEQSVSSSMVDRNEEDVLGADGNSKEESLVVEDELAHPEYSAVECFLCGGLETNPKAACSMGFLVSCGECEQWVHSYCMPSSKFPELNVLKAQRNKTIHTRSCVSGAEDGRTWLCWRCIECNGCSSCLWDKPMTIWNARRTEPLAPDLDLVLCGECLDRYKNVQDYCPICYQLYDNERYGCQTKPYSSKVDRKPTQLIETVINANIGTTRISKKGKKAVNMEASSITSLADNENAAFSETVLDNADVVEEAFIPVVQSEVEEALENTVVTLNADDDMIECNECNRWIHALCEGMDEGQYHAITEGRHPVWGDEYLCPICRVRLGLEILEELSTIDTTRMFAYPVTESVASSYFDIIRNPMDMSTMQGKAKKGQYKSLQALRQDFELMCLNAIRFNKVHDQYWNAAKKFYVQGVLIFDEHTRKSHQTAYGLELQEVLDEYATTENRNSRKKKPKRKSEDHNANSIGDDVLKKKKPDVLAVKNGDISEHEQTSSMTEELGKQSTEQNPMEISSEVLKNDLRLHTCLYPYDEAECYQSCFAVVQPIDEAYFTFTQDICFLCGSKGATDCMLFCVDCGECFHSFCANAPFSTMTASTRTNWRCSNCKLCYCCGVASKDDATTLIYCECCDKSYHMLCLKPAINPGLVPEKINWYCADCVTCRYCDGIPFPSWGLKTVECAHCVIVKGKKNRCLNEISKISYIKDLKSIVVLTIKTYGVWLAAEIDRWQTISETFYIARPGITRIVSNQYEDPRGWVSTALQTTDPLSQDRNSAQLCSHCSRMCITNYVPCQNCYSRTHYSCINTIFDGPLFTGTKSMTIAETAATICADYLCKRCILYLYGYESQFGTWDQSVSIYAAAAEIQRNRTIYQVKKLQSDVSTYRTGMCSLIYWAASRAFSNIAEETVVKSPVTNCSYIHWFCSLNVPSWVRCRAEEFVLLLKRYLDAGENIVAPDIARKQLCIQQFCYKYARGGVVESTSPSNNICSEEETKLVATLAAAYLHCVYIELPKAVYTNDCSSIAREILQMSFSNGKINVSNQTVSSTEVNVLANQLKVAKKALLRSPLNKEETALTVNLEVTTKKSTTLAANNSHTSSSSSYSPAGHHKDFEVSPMCDPNELSLPNSRLEIVTLFRLSAEKYNGIKFHSTDVRNGLANVSNSLRHLNSDGSGSGKGRGKVHVITSKKERKKGTKADVEDPSEKVKKTKLKPIITNYVSICTLGGYSNDYFAKQTALQRPYLSIPKSIFGQNGVVLLDKVILPEVEQSVTLAKKAVLEKLREEQEDKVASFIVDTITDNIADQLLYFAGSIVFTDVCNSAASNPHLLILHPIIPEPVFSLWSVSTELDRERFAQAKSLTCSSTLALIRATLNYIDHMRDQKRVLLYILDDLVNNTIQEVVKELFDAIANEGECGQISLVANGNGESNGKVASTGRVDLLVSKSSASFSSNSSSSSSSSANDLKKVDQLSEISSTLVAKGKRDIPLQLPESIIDTELLMELSQLLEKARAPRVRLHNNYALPVPLCGWHGSGVYYTSSSALIEGDPRKNGLTTARDETSSSLKSEIFGVEAKMPVPWVDASVCALCNNIGDDSPLLGRLLQFSCGTYVHVNCLRWSANVHEHKHALTNGYGVLEKAAKSFCFYCRERGASISCFKCRRSYHLPCAYAGRCFFVEARKEEDSPDELHDIDTFVYCPEHQFEITKKKSLRNGWLPHDPSRCITILDSLNNQSDSLFEFLSAKRVDRAVRSGALTVFNVGHVSARAEEFHTDKFIYPYKYKAAKIYWSMHQPMRRTVYVLEIFADSDFEWIDAAEMEYINESLCKHWKTPKYHRRQQMEGPSEVDDYTCEDFMSRGLGSHFQPVFRVVAMDNPTRPIFARSLEDIHEIIMKNVEKCFSQYYSKHGFAHTMRLGRSGEYPFGVSPHQFFGIGLPVVRLAIESMPASVNAMLFSRQDKWRYRPSYRLPNAEDVARAHQLQINQTNDLSTSLNGSARADAYVGRESRPTGKKITRILTKAADEDPSEVLFSAPPGMTGDDEQDEAARVKQLEEEERRVSLQLDEIALREKYILMSKSYLVDPYARLEVKKSRIHGWGLFARISFERNDVVIEYIGEKIRQAMADRREEKYELDGVGSCYLFRMDKDEIVDATCTGGMARFINHCCEPNAYARILSAPDPTAPATADRSADVKHITIIAARDIQEGEEITYDYKFPIEEKKLRCYCGAPKCSGAMN